MNFAHVKRLVAQDDPDWTDSKGPGANLPESLLVNLDHISLISYADSFGEADQPQFVLHLHNPVLLHGHTFWSISVFALPGTLKGQL